MLGRVGPRLAPRVRGLVGVAPRFKVAALVQRALPDRWPARGSGRPLPLRFGLERVLVPVLRALELGLVVILGRLLLGLLELTLRRLLLLLGFELFQSDELSAFVVHELAVLVVRDPEHVAVRLGVGLGLGLGGLGLLLGARVRALLRGIVDALLALLLGSRAPGRDARDLKSLFNFVSLVKI